jgi:hypothetical protein
MSTVTQRDSATDNDQPTQRPTSRLDLLAHYQLVLRTSVACPQTLGGLPCMNDQPHPGNGRGCVHYSSSGIPDRHDLGDDD